VQEKGQQITAGNESGLFRVPQDDKMEYNQDGDTPFVGVVWIARKKGDNEGKPELSYLPLSCHYSPWLDHHLTRSENEGDIVRVALYKLPQEEMDKLLAENDRSTTQKVLDKFSCFGRV